MTVFRPCIDLHQGQVKQIVGGSLSDDSTELKTNFVAEHDAAWFADCYKREQLTGGHVIKLGPGNDEAARAALQAWPQGLQLGGGITTDNAVQWLDAGAEKLIVTSSLFEQNDFSFEKLDEFEQLIGKERLVVDLSCRQVDATWFVASNRWQTITTLEINAENLQRISSHCSEFLIHAADVEGKCQGIDEALVRFLGKHCPIPATYAGGAHDLSDLQLVSDLSNQQLDLTFGSALDIFGGHLVQFADCISWNKRQ